jgi:hypothetical protein
MNAHIRVADLIAQMATGLGASSGNDLFFYWLEEQYRFIREKAWAWNWSKKYHLTHAAQDEGDVITFDYNEGNDFILASAPLALNYFMTGRKVQLGDEWYRILDYGLTNASRVYVDRAILGSATGVQPTFHRDEYWFPGNKLRYVEMDGKKLVRLPEHHLQRKYWGRVHPSSASTPQSYIDDDSRKLPPPGYAPTVASAGAGTLPVGEYIYFYTRYDVESGLESAPGPSTTFTNIAGTANRVVYGNPAGDKSEYSSYGLRLYRSLVSPTRNRAPMWLVEQRAPTAPGAPFDDATTAAALVTKTRFYDGASAVVRLWPPPDSDRHTLMIDHVNCWGGRMYEEEYLELGRNDEILETLRIFLKGVLDIKNGDANAYKIASATHRAQVSYLLTQSREAGEGDAGPDSHFPPVAGPEPMLQGDWVDMLPWKD